MRSTKMLYRNARDSLHRVLRVVVDVDLAYSGPALQGPCCLSVGNPHRDAR
jgi:hypothetical protein